MKDKELYRLVQDKLSSYEAPYEKAHWQMMADKIKSHPTGKIGAQSGSGKWKNMGFLLLLLLLATGVYTFVISPGKEVTSLSKSERPVSNINNEKIRKPETSNSTSTTEVRKEEINPSDVAAKPLLAGKRGIEKKNQNPVAKINHNGRHEDIIDHMGEDEQTNIALMAKRPWKAQFYFQPVSNTALLEMQIRSNLISKKMTEDSTTFKIFERNSSHWKNAVVVCDWTTSMFKHGTEVVNWLAAQKDAENIKGFVFFNDCDQDGNAVKESKMPGEMFAVHSTNIDEVLQAMIATVRKGGANKDLEENDAEALKYAVEEFEGIDEIILIADNVSPVRQLGLLKDVNVPVKIVICGSTYIENLPIQSDYFKIATKTGGSIHTVEDDLYELSPIAEDTWIKVGKTYYKYKNGHFKATTRKNKPKKRRS